MSAHPETTTPAAPDTETPDTETPTPKTPTPAAPPPEAPPPRTPPPARPFVPFVLALAAIAILGSGFTMYRRSRAKTNAVTLASEPKPVSVVEAHGTTFRPKRRYVATLAPWLQAKIGPQLVSAYVDTVLFRPGARVKKGEVLATLDCRNASADAQAVSMAARALETKQASAAREAARIQGMLDGGFVSENEVEKKLADSAAQQADILAAKAKLLGSSLEVNDCVLKSPFEGEVDARMADPGSFVRPGAWILAVVDRSTVRIAADVPETDFPLVAPGTSVRIRIVATGRAITAPITRRSPSADPSTRTVHFEIDLSDPDRSLPVGTTAELSVDLGEPIAAAEIPLRGAAVRGDKATVFVLEEADGAKADPVLVAKKRTVAVLGESGGSLYLDPALHDAKIVTEGRALLDDGDRVRFAVTPFVPAAVPAPTASSSAGVKAGMAP